MASEYEKDLWARQLAVHLVAEGKVDTIDSRQQYLEEKRNLDYPAKYRFDEFGNRYVYNPKWDW